MGPVSSAGKGTPPGRKAKVAAKAVVQPTTTAKAKPLRDDDISSLPRKRGPGWRAEKSELTRQRLFEAAIRLVGEDGHAGATIRRITARARIAQGTFYNYFASQQDIVEQILPYLGERLLAYLDERLDASVDFVARQDSFMVAFDDFVRETPAFYRVVSEAEVFTPKAFRVYMANTLQWLTRRLASAPGLAGEASIDGQRLELVALMLLASANHINMRFGQWMGEDARIPSWAIETFGRFVQAGIGSLGGARPTAALPAAVPEQAAVAHVGAGHDDTAPADSFVKFTPRLSRHDGRLSYSAQSVQLDCRFQSLAPGHVILELDVDRRTLNSRGAVSGGTLSALAEIAAASAMADRAEEITAETIQLSCAMIRPALEGVLVAEARLENAGRHIRFCTVRVTLGSTDGPVVANATATMRVLE